MTAAAKVETVGVPLAVALTCTTGMWISPLHTFLPVARKLLDLAPTAPVFLDDPKTRATLRVRALALWPQLSAETGNGVSRDNLRGWLRNRVARYGATLPLHQA